MVVSSAASTGGSVSLGQVERTPRAFWQDAWAAMDGNIVRALVEYITNTDDSYAKKRVRGRIRIEVEHKRGDEPWDARVRDRAAGMTLAEMREKIGKQGVRTSGFADGEPVRGNLGLGSKDPACFGKVIFESIKEGVYAWFAIDSDGERTSIRGQASDESGHRLDRPGDRYLTYLTPPTDPEDRDLQSEHVREAGGALAMVFGIEDVIRELPSGPTVH